MSIKLMARVWEKEVNATDQRVLLVLCDHANDEGTDCYPSIDWVAWKLGVNYKTVLRAIKSLETLGVLTVVREHRRPNKYTINLEVLPDKPGFSPRRRPTGGSQKGTQDPVGSHLHSDEPGSHPGASPGSHLVTLGSHLGGAEPPGEPAAEPPTGGHEHPLHATSEEDAGMPERSTLSGRFERWYANYPKKKGKQDARRAWNRIRPDEALTGRMIAAVAAQHQAHDWQKAGGQYIPYPARWLNAGMWEDEAEAVAPAPSPAGDGIRQAFREASKGYSATDLLRATHLPVSPGQRARLQQGEPVEAVLTPEQLDLAKSELRRASSAKRMFNTAGTVF